MGGWQLSRERERERERVEKKKKKKHQFSYSIRGEEKIRRERSKGGMNEIKSEWTNGFDVLQLETDTIIIKNVVIILCSLYAYLHWKLEPEQTLSCLCHNFYYCIYVYMYFYIVFERVYFLKKNWDDFLW